MCILVNGRIELFTPANHIGLIWNFQVSPSSCGNHEHYEQYIKLCAADDQGAGRGTTHIFLTESDCSEHVAGFITLRASTLTKEFNGVIYGEPAIEISELAVDASYAGKGIGRILVDFAIAKADMLNCEHLGIRYIVVCSDPQSVGFYEKCKFTRLSDAGRVPREGWNEDCIPLFLKLPNAF